MKTLKANNLTQAQKELEAIDGLTDEKIAKLKSAVREADKKLYHVILVKKIHDAANQKYLVSFIVQQYNTRAFAKVKTSVTQLGFYKAIVLHDPTQVAEDETPTLTTFDKRAIESQVKKDLEAKHKKEIDDLRAELEEKTRASKTDDGNGADDTGAGNDDTTIVGEIEVETAKKDELLKFAEDNKIELGEDTKVDTIRPIIAKWIEDNKKTKE